MARRLDYNQVKEFIESKGFLLVSTEYKNNSSKLQISCPTHGIFEMSFNNFQTGHYCKKCSGEVKGERQAGNPEEFKEYVKNTKYELLTPYVRNFLKVKMRCPEHGEFEIRPNDFKQEKGCWKCGDIKGSEKRSYVPPAFHENLQNNKYELITPYHRTEEKVQIKCPIHGIFEMTPHAIISGQGCPNCRYVKSSQKLRKDPTIFAKQVESTKYELLSDYILSNEKVTFKCPDHGEFEMTPSNFSNGHRCSKCVRVITPHHAEIIDYIKTIYGGEIVPNDRKTLKGMELDIWIPEKKFGIEYDGLYWHSEKAKQRPDLANKEKIRRVQEANINFLAVFSDEWENETKKEIIKSMISHRLNKSSEVIYARDTTIEDIDKEVAKKFMMENHLDGHVMFKKAIGLVDKSKRLVMCITLKTSFTKELELARMATLKYTSVVGGASKLLNAIKESFVSFSNNRLSNGNIYKSLNFVEITKTTSPSYYYTDCKIRVWRFNCRKIAGKPGTEREQAEAGLFEKRFGHKRSVFRIYDYGHRKWLKSN